MSYILDALKRADTERERGTVPGLHAQQRSTPSAALAARGARSGLWLTVVALLVLATIAASLWVWQAPTPSSLAQSAPAPSAPNAAALAPAPAVSPVPASALPAVVTPTVTPVAPSAVVTPAPTLVPPVFAPQALPKPAVASATKAAAPTAPAALPLWSELPEELRRQMPALAITGAVYSEFPAQRMLLVNGQVATQGSEVSSELKLEEIQAHSSVFNFRGTRFRMNH
jgi:general secretion pathway protein B